MMPVLSCSMDTLNQRPDWRDDLRGAMADVTKEPKAPRQLTIWGREGPGNNERSEPVQVLFMYIATPRGGSRAVALLLEALTARWGNACRTEGANHLAGGERALGGIVDGEVRLFAA